MIRIREIDDVELRERIRALIAEQRDMPAAAVPDWFEMDDADFSELLISLDRRPVDPDDAAVD